MHLFYHCIYYSWLVAGAGRRPDIYAYRYQQAPTEGTSSAYGARVVGLNVMSTPEDNKLHPSTKPEGTRNAFRDKWLRYVAVGYNKS
jgi:hypothetical protein